MWCSRWCTRDSTTADKTDVNKNRRKNIKRRKYVDRNRWKKDLIEENTPQNQGQHGCKQEGG
jgi:hypothetical protein